MIALLSLAALSGQNPNQPLSELQAETTAEVMASPQSPQVDATAVNADRMATLKTDRSVSVASAQQTPQALHAGVVIEFIKDLLFGDGSDGGGSGGGDDDSIGPHGGGHNHSIIP